MGGDTRLHYVRRGEGPPLLLIQGSAATHRHWGERLPAALARSFDVVTYDHRGTGGSPTVREAFTIADLAEDAAELLDALAWPRASVFGVSLGAVVALELARRHPDRVRRLVLGCAPSGLAEDRSARPAAAVGTIVRGDPAATADNLFRVGVGDARTLPPEARSEYREAFLACPVPPRTAVLQADALARHRTGEASDGLSAPTLVVHGEADRLVALDEGLELARRIPGARLEVLPAGHFFWLEDPATTARLVGEFCLDGWS